MDWKNDELQIGLAYQGDPKRKTVGGERRQEGYIHVSLEVVGKGTAGGEAKKGWTSGVKGGIARLLSTEHR